MDDNKEENLTAETIKKLRKVADGYEAINRAKEESEDISIRLLNLEKENAHATNNQSKALDISKKIQSLKFEEKINKEIKKQSDLALELNKMNQDNIAAEDVIEKKRQNLSKLTGEDRDAAIKNIKELLQEQKLNKNQVSLKQQQLNQQSKMVSLTKKNVELLQEKQKLDEEAERRSDLEQRRSALEQSNLRILNLEKENALAINDKAYALEISKQIQSLQFEEQINKEKQKQSDLDSQLSKLKQDNIAAEDVIEKKRQNLSKLTKEDRDAAMEKIEELLQEQKLIQDQVSLKQQEYDQQSEMVSLTKKNVELLQAKQKIDEEAARRSNLAQKQQSVINEITVRIGEGATKIGNAYSEIVKSTNRWRTGLMFVLKEGADLFVSYEKTAEAFRKETGLTISQSKDQRALAEQINAEYQRFGVNLEDAYKSISAIQATFGGLRLDTNETVRTTALLAANFGVAAENTAQVLSKFQGLGGATQDVSINTIKSAAAISRAAGIPFAKVMEDVAKASDDVLVTVGATPQKLLAASIQARALGIDLNTAASAARKLLDFNTSINDELNASALLGRSVNFQKARQLAFDGNIVEANKEILRQVRMAGNFDKMNVFQKEALAKAAGMELSSLNKMIAVENIRMKGTPEQKKRLALLEFETKNTKELTNATNDKILLDKEMQSLMTNLNNTFKQIAVSVARFIVPLIEGLGIILNLFTFLALPLVELDELFAKAGDTASKWYRGTIAAATLYAVLMRGKVTSSIVSVINFLKTKTLSLAAYTKALFTNTAALKINAAAAGPAAAGVTGMTGAVGRTGSMSSTILKGTAVLLLISAALFVFGKATQQFADVQWGNVAIGIVGMFALAGALALFGLKLKIAVIPIAAALLVIGGISLAFFAFGKSIKAVADGIEKLGTGIKDIVTSFANVSSAKGGLDFMKSLNEISINEDVINKLERLATLSSGLMQTALAMEKLSSAVSSLSEVNYDAINVGTIRNVAEIGTQTPSPSVSMNPVVEAINKLRQDLLAGNIVALFDKVDARRDLA